MNVQACSSTLHKTYKIIQLMSYDPSLYEANLMCKRHLLQSKQTVPTTLLYHQTHHTHHTNHKQHQRIITSNSVSISESTVTVLQIHYIIFRLFAILPRAVSFRVLTNQNITVPPNVQEGTFCLSCIRILS